jgi:hypothetical protein
MVLKTYTSSITDTGFGVDFLPAMHGDGIAGQPALTVE